MRQPNAPADTHTQAVVLVRLVAVASVVVSAFVTIVDRAAWPVLAGSAVVCLVTVAATMRRASSSLPADRVIDIEVAAGIAELERWLASRRQST